MSSDPRIHYDSMITAGMFEASQLPGDSPFDIFEWYPHYQSCQRYFLDHAQHTVQVQTFSSFLNIHLPFQRQPTPIFNSAADAALPSPPGGTPSNASIALSVSMVPYIRRLVATGMDYRGVLNGFFGDSWESGIGPLHKQERRNFLFAAKSGGWAAVKKDYDILPYETIPFLRPLQGSENAEIEAAEKSWSEWLAMEDWMVGPRSPDEMADGQSNTYSKDSRSTRS
ncbi:hypothetical protein FQN49_001439 [Arthroderma sp. PD_2]|nr:hypothetical protein FQN49_001439 [Arthroderma sp. PD_2]